MSNNMSLDFCWSSTKIKRKSLSTKWSASLILSAVRSVGLLYNHCYVLSSYITVNIAVQLNGTHGTHPSVLSTASWQFTYAADTLHSFKFMLTTLLFLSYTWDVRNTILTSQVYLKKLRLGVLAFINHGLLLLIL